ncbi:MAG: T9SS type A sorting domain-containing protein [Ignavibacteria bacterium]|nr:T9SS type A sorting domain-containing protein [Ignavibacteria bacterium]
MSKSLTFVFTLLLAVSAFAQTVLEGDITTTVNLTSNNTYLLRGFVRVQSGGILNIQPGTKIFGENSTQGSLVVKPGGKIFAEGTASQPIVFTSEFTKPGASRPPTYGDWGGVIILGNAPINVPGGTTSIEGPGDSYGGNNPDDNSGVLKYVRIEYPGIAFSLNNEINGLTLGGVGRGTLVEYIQVSYSGDDSFEFFGGTVNAKYLIAFRGWDDDFDTDFGYTGKLQFLFGLRDPEIADQSGSNGFESDNDGTGSTNQPLTSPEWWNVTLIGPISTSGQQINSLFRRGMHLRRNSQNRIANAVIVGWPTGLLLDSKGTINGAANSTMYVKNSVIAQCNKLLDTASSNGTFNISTWFNTTMSGRTFSAAADLQMVNPFNLASPNATLVSGSPLLTGGLTPPTDAFFDPTATFVGAFGSTDWTAGWANFNPSGATSVKEDQLSNTPADFELSQNYPNPFNPSTKIRFALPEAGNVKLSVYDVLGRQVAELVNEFRAAGTYEVDWQADNLSSGVYVYRLESGTKNINRTMNLLK